MPLLSLLQVPPPVPAAPLPARPLTTRGGIDLVWATLRGMGNGLLSRLPYLVIGLLVLLAFYGLGRLTRRAAHEAGERTRLDVRLADVFGTLAVILFTSLGVLVAAVIIFPSFTPGALVQGLGVTSVAVGFAFKDILQNFFAGVLILLRKPFIVGDQIRVKDHEGTVDEINTRSTRLTTYDGERVVIPNGDVYTSSIVVRTAHAKRRVKFSVGIGYPDSIEEARATIVRVVTGTEGVLPDPGPQAYVDELAGSSVNFVVYFWTNSRQADVLRVRDRVATRIKLALDAAKIDMPFPHTVVLFHDQTGNDTKDAAGDRGAGRPEARAAPNGAPNNTPNATPNGTPDGAPHGPGHDAGRGADGGSAALSRLPPR